MKTTDAVTILRDRYLRRTMYKVVLKPAFPEGVFYTLDNVKELCYTRFKLWAWFLFTIRGWRLPEDHSIQIITLRPEK